MVYNNDLKKWEYAGGSQGLSQIHVYHNPNQETYRIVGRKINDKEVSFFSKLVFMRFAYHVFDIFLLPIDVSLLLNFFALMANREL